MEDRFKFRFFNGTKMIYDANNHAPQNLMQCTGLKDKNGKSIYEGDILSIRIPAGYDDCYCHIDHVVFWDKEIFSYSVKPILKEEWQKSYSEELGICEYYTSDIEIIGNIHTNPELLTKEQ